MEDRVKSSDGDQLCSRKPSGVKSIHWGWGIGLFVCALVAACTIAFDPTPREICDNGIDDTGNGLTDCEDPHCEDHPACIEYFEICDNGIDDTGNGLTDCEDPECAEEWFCKEPQPCNNDGVCDVYENPFWCADCCPDCNISTGETYDYIAAKVILAKDEYEAQFIGVDLNGDGKVNNAFGAITDTVPSVTGDYNGEIQGAILDGEYIFLGRLHLSDWSSEDIVAVQVFSGNGTLDATEDNLTGYGQTVIDPGANRSLHVCGELTDNMLETCPGYLEVPLHFLMETMLFPLEKARVVSTDRVTETEWTEMMIGGGLSQESVDDFLLPALLVYLNKMTIEDPNSNIADFVEVFLDGRCSPGLPGCEDVVNREGDCARWTGDPDDPPLTLTELKCNLIVRSVTKPDWDSTGDGTPDLLSFGIMVQAIPITITN